MGKQTKQCAILLVIQRPIRCGSQSDIAQRTSSATPHSVARGKLMKRRTHILDPSQVSCDDCAVQRLKGALTETLAAWGFRKRRRNANPTD